MPILAKEPDMFPEGLLEQAGAGPDDSWFAMYTLARQEKELMRKLRPLKIAHYGPMIAQRKRSPAGRIRTSYVPLFTGYVFVRCDEVGRHDAVSTGCISRCLSVAESEELIADLRCIRQLVTVGSDIRPEPKPVIGRAAIVKTGAMKGLRGTVTKALNQHRLTILVNFMHQGASVIVDEADVELL
ncbi:MAG: antitermination protein NusG [Planctomycetota bacterium]|nr:antitermination protein NusG [Planctomycetota bacterium]